MHRWTCWSLALVGLVTLTTASSARALVVAPPPGPNRVAQADVIVVGRVVAHEDRDIEVAMPGGAKTTYRVAIVNVAETVKGAKGAKMIRVGFTPVMAPVAPGGGLVVRPIRPGMRGVSFEVGQDGMFFLTKHPKENLYTAPMYYDAVLRNNPNFERELETAKKTARMLENPLESLKSANAMERLQTASLLLTQYRQPRFRSDKTEPIPAEESKLILKAILDGNWGPPPGRPGRPGRPIIGGPGFGAPVNSLNLFFQLGLTAKDGWTLAPGTNPQEAAKEWLTKNWETYRIQRIIPGEGGAVGGRPRVPGGPVILPVDRVPVPVQPLPIKKIRIKLDRN